jgi:hypothetical protein
MNLKQPLILDCMEPPEFAANLINFNRLLEGENRQSPHRDDAEHWYAVYSDLVGFKEALLGQTKEHIRKVPESKTELAAHDVPFLEAELGRLRSGMEFWAAKRNQE